MYIKVILCQQGCGHLSNLISIKTGLLGRSFLYWAPYMQVNYPKRYELHLIKYAKRPTYVLLLGM